MKKNVLAILKKVLASSFAMILAICSFAGCNGNGQCASCSNELAKGEQEVCNTCATGNKEVLNGKKIIFIGNSYTYYGQTVLEKNQAILDQESRSNDEGYFYQLCKANGVDVNVTNWTFGGHGAIRDLFSGNCVADRGCNGIDHASYLTDRNYDYVVIQAGPDRTPEDTYLTEMNKIMDFFKAGNAETKFIVSVPYCCYGVGTSNTLMAGCLNALKTLAEQGVIISDWGGLVADILNKKVQVPNTAFEYTNTTFIVAKSTKDGYHPNLMSGYITTLMTYCAITGATAQAKTYDFCNDSSLNAKFAEPEWFSFQAFKSKYYMFGKTNFIDVFSSTSEMKGIQKLVDEHLANKAYMNYNY